MKILYSTLIVLFLIFGVYAFSLLSEEKNFFNTAYFIFIFSSLLILLVWILIFRLRNSIQTVVFLIIFLSVTGVVFLFFFNSIQAISYIFFALVMLLVSIIKSPKWAFVLFILFGLLAQFILWLQVREFIPYDDLLIANSYWRVLIPILMIFSVGEVSHNLNSSIENSYFEARKVASEIENKNEELELLIASREESIRESFRSEINTYQVSANYGGIFRPMLHDISTPLSTALGAMNLVEDNPDDVRYLSASLDQLKDIFLQTDTILEGGEDLYTEVDVADVISRINSVLHTVLLKEMIEFKITGLRDVKVYGSIISFERICLNLILNSIEALKGNTNGRKIIHIRCYLHEEYSIISFYDNGKGIKKENLKSIFEPSYTSDSSDSNLGLGLDYVKNEIGKFDGTVDVKSEYQKYTKVTLSIKSIS